MLPVARHTRALTIWPPSRGRPGRRLKTPTSTLAKATMPSSVSAVSFVVRARRPQTTAARARLDSGPTTATMAVVLGDVRVAS